MQIQVTCPNCNASLSLPVYYSSTSTICPFCDGKIALPGAEALEASLSDDSITIVCSCSASIRVPRERSGTVVVCPECEQTVAIPSADARAHLADDPQSPGKPEAKVVAASTNAGEKDWRDGTEFLSGYRIVGDLLGEGGFGKVYRARCALTENEFAVKRAKLKNDFIDRRAILPA